MRGDITQVLDCAHGRAWELAAPHILHFQDFPAVLQSGAISARSNPAMICVLPFFNLAEARHARPRMYIAAVLHSQSVTQVSPVRHQSVVKY
jgi:hypothetical protein